MKKLLIVITLLCSCGLLYSEELHMENFIVKEISNRAKSETFYLGQIKSKKDFETFVNNYAIEEIENYSGFHDVIKAYNKDIDLYFTKGEVYTLVEIHIKADKYYLQNTSITVNKSIEEALTKYSNSFTKIKNNDNYYFAEIEDYTSEFSNLAFLNISLCVNDEIIEKIVLYYSFTL